MLDLLPDGRIGHIVVADTADAVVVAPATAHWLGAMAGGLSGDVVTATCLATSAPVVVAPAMDGDMWTPSGHRRQRRAAARRFGYTVVEPGSGPLASGQDGIGRLAELDAIVDAVVAAVGASADPRAGSGGTPAPRRSGARRRPGRPPRRGHRRRDARGDRPGPLHRQSLDRPDGRRHRRGRARPRRAGDARRRERRGRSAAGGHGRPGRIDRRPARRAAAPHPGSEPPPPASTPWSWPPPSPTSGRSPPPRRKLARDATT